MTFPSFQLKKGQLSAKDLESFPPNLKRKLAILQWCMIGLFLVMVCFMATWCGLCKSLAPIIEMIAREHDGECKVGMLDIDDFPETAKKYGIRSIPTVLVFKNGAIVAQHVGLATKPKIEDLMKASL